MVTESALELLDSLDAREPQWNFGIHVGSGSGSDKTRSDWLDIQATVLRTRQPTDWPGDPDWALAATWLALAVKELWPDIVAKAKTIGMAELRTVGGAK